MHALWRSACTSAVSQLLFFRDVLFVFFVGCLRSLKGPNGLAAKKRKGRKVRGVFLRLFCGQLTHKRGGGSTTRALGGGNIRKMTSGRVGRGLAVPFCDLCVLCGLLLPFCDSCAFFCGHSSAGPGGLVCSHPACRPKPSSSQPVMPPIMSFTGRPSFARRMAPRWAPLQCGPAQ